MEEVKEWIKGDESAREMLGRQQQKQIPSFVLPPFHRIPLRLGNVVEILGPSPSAKSQLLLHAAVNCILPKEWNGAYYGGLEQLVMFLDLDGGFDILRLSQLLKLRIAEASGSSNEDNQHSIANNVLSYHIKKESSIAFDEELLASCMRRFLYIRCYDTLEFLATLKVREFFLDQCMIFNIGWPAILAFFKVPLKHGQNCATFTGLDDITIVWKFSNHLSLGLGATTLLPHAAIVATTAAIELSTKCEKSKFKVHGIVSVHRAILGHCLVTGKIKPQTCQEIATYGHNGLKGRWGEVELVYG
ncbi:hypothetical protein RJ641_009878 [Dillenia turbinata]|uniref:RecA family profile 1 domain-containing protein n=1 Tax=Dillenia turbinata TaxID=194707 RepID=A0AAN8UV74_9MAGN